MVYYRLDLKLHVIKPCDPILYQLHFIREHKQNEKYKLINSKQIGVTAHSNAHQ